MDGPGGKFTGSPAQLALVEKIEGRYKFHTCVCLLSSTVVWARICSSVHKHFEEGQQRNPDKHPSVFDRALYTMIGCKERSAATPSAWENSFENGRVTENKNLILVVDDNTDCRELLVMTLRFLGCPVISAVDGAEALELAIACRPKLIFMDLSMPNMDGCDASRAIHAHAETRGIPIVALSANGNETKQRSNALDAGCIECWVKPFRMELILELLERLFHAA